MGRFWLGAGLLLLFLVLGIWTTLSMDATHTPLSQTLEAASQAALDGDIQKGAALGMQAKADWERHRRYTAAVADHTPMDEIDALFSEMAVYAQASEDVHFAACCAQLSLMVRAMGEAHALNWWSFL